MVRLANSPDLQVAVLGAGAVTRIFYAPLFAAGVPGLQLKLIADRSGGALKRLPALPAEVDLVEADFTELLIDEQRTAGLDAVIVALPHHLHEAAVCQALRAGLHVLCEKPIALTGASLDRISAAAASAGRLLAACQPRRHFPAAVAIRQLIRRRWLGDCQYVTWQEGGPYAWPAESLAQLRADQGGEELYDIGAHVFDLLAWWFGDLTVSSYADDSRGGAAATFDVSLVSHVGVAVEVRLSRLIHLSNSVHLAFEAGEVVWDTKQPDALHVTAADDDPIRSIDLRFPELPQDMLAALRRELEQFGKAVQGATPPSVSADEAGRYVQIFDQCRAQQAPRKWVSTTSVSETVDFRSPLRRRIAITGAAGFIGCRLVERLVEQAEDSVLAIVRQPQSCARLARCPVEIGIGDVRDRGQMSRLLKGVDLVVHCATGGRDEQAQWQTIVEGTDNVLQAADENNVRRVVALSSMLAYGDPPPSGRIVEDSSGTSKLGYAKAKAEMSRRCQAFARQGVTHVVVLEPSCVFGPFSPDFVTGPLQQMRAGDFFFVEGGRGLANLVYVDNLIDAILAALHQPCRSGSRYLVSEPEWSTTWWQFFTEIAAAADIPKTDLPSLTRAEYDRVARQHRARRRFPSALRHAVRRDPIARQWLAQQPLFRLWKRLRSGRPVASHGTTLTKTVAPVNIEASNSRAVDIPSRLSEKRKLPEAEALFGFFDSQAVCDTSRIRKELNWRPEVPRAAAMAATAAWVRETYCPASCDQPHLESCG